VTEPAAPNRAPAPSRRHGEAALELHRLRADAQARYGEVDLLVVTLRDHIRDLRAERDALRAQIQDMADAVRRESAVWLWRGSKGMR
jgi:hypothetical protein